ncbi:MAG: hypothetical protein QOE93_352 [Actinomycetota bacterium]|jgi:glycosyltransferase involved in cell wall biosynthesis|nr:hypothetical protein [Actinomycetota bacterium]
MRVGIDYRILAVGDRLISRGMPRFTQQQLRAVLEAGGDDEYLLLYSQGADLSLIDPAIRSAPNVTPRCFPQPTTGSYPRQAEASALLRRSEEYLDWIDSQQLDVYHATTPFLLHEPVLSAFDACPVVATFYDIIPLVWPGEYLDNFAARTEYQRTIAFLQRADRLLAISEWSRGDAITYLGVPADRIDLVWPLADPCFRPMDRALVDQILYGLRRRAGVPEHFVLAVSHLHHSKNLGVLLDGYARLPATVRAQLPLVVACHFDENGVRTIRALIDKLDLDADVILTGLVSNSELAALYNAATMLVHPSRYEGFGLPVLEAMQAGTPVITTTASSLPEVAGDAAVLVDSEDPAAFAHAINAVYHDPERRREMVARGFERAKLFSPEQLAAGTLESYRRAAAAGGGGADPAGPGRPRIALWTLLPPQPSGVAEYSVELLEALRRTCDVEVFVGDDVAPDEDLLWRHRVHHHHAFGRRHRRRPFDSILYQLGGQPDHLFMHGALQAYPGIAVLHDLTVSHLLYTYHSRRGDLEAFVQEVAELEGWAAVVELSDALDQGSPARELELSDFLFAYPMLGAVIDRSQAQIVHYDAARIELEERYPRSNPFTVPMGVAGPRPLRPTLVRLDTRRRLGIDDATFVVGAFGVVHPFKRSDTCVEAFAALAADHPDSVLLVAGEIFHPSYADDLAELAERLGVADRVRFMGRTPKELFDDCLVACDVVVNLRFPFMKQMSATLVRAVAAAKPVITTDLPEWRFLPDSFCLRVAPGEGEVETLAGHLRALAGDRHLRRRMSDAADAYYQRTARVDQMAASYLDVIGSVAGHLEPQLRPVTGPGGRALQLSLGHLSKRVDQ